MASNSLSAFDFIVLYHWKSAIGAEKVATLLTPVIIQTKDKCVQNVISLSIGLLAIMVTMCAIDNKHLGPCSHSSSSSIQSSKSRFLSGPGRRHKSDEIRLSIFVILRKQKSSLRLYPSYHDLARSRRRFI